MSCGALGAVECTRARGLIAAAGTFSDVKHDYILDPTASFSPGRGIERTASGLWSAVPSACAQADAAAPAAKVDAQTIDFGFVGVAVDTTLVSADADLTPFLGAGGEASTHKIRLVAIAFARDLDPQFFDASPNVTYGAEGCACGRATHFIGAVKVGGMLSFETEVRAGEVHARAIDFVRARLADSHASVTETRVGGLEVEGLEAALAGGVSRPLTFKVASPVPLAYAVYPIADVCRFALPAPDVSPTPMDFGDAAYGKESTRLLHVVNRASIDLHAVLGARTFAVPARGSLDVPLTWAPEGDAPGCEAQTREETVLFVPQDPAAPVTPKQQTARVVEQVRTGRPAVARTEHIDTGESRRPTYAATSRDWTCPPDFTVSACRVEQPQCADTTRTCTSDGYGVVAAQVGNGCHFACSGPNAILSAQFCRFDATMECRLRCGSR
jgi:hypothetical protein